MKSYLLLSYVQKRCFTSYLCVANEISNQEKVNQTKEVNNSTWWI